MLKNYLFPFLFLLFCLIGCKKEILKNDSINADDVLLNSSKEGKIYFAKTLAKAVEKDQILRQFIKEEALKMFDKDYDILYQFVKDSKLSDGRSFYEKLSKYASSQDSLDNALNAVPLLTIFLPKLPQFNPIDWNTVDEVPTVALENDSETKDITYFYGEDDMFKAPAELVPGFATLVIKDNERIVFNNGKGTYAKNNQSQKIMYIEKKSHNASGNFLSENGLSFSFVDEVFNGIKKQNQVVSLALQSLTLSSSRYSDSSRQNIVEQDDRYNPYVAPISKVQRIVDAIDNNVEWQRDYIYYGINPAKGVNSGARQEQMEEYFTSLRFKDGQSIYDNITESPSDPIPLEVATAAKRWTDGQYEFVLTILINAKNGPLPNTRKPFIVKPDDVFDITYERKEIQNTGHTREWVYYNPIAITSKVYLLPEPIPINPWDLENTALGWQVFLSKYNAAQTVTETYTMGSEFITNFEESGGIDIKIIKLGAKSGGSEKTTRTSTFTFQRTIGPNDFGDRTVYFNNPVFLSYTRYKVRGSEDMIRYKPYELDLGKAYVTIEPRASY